MTKFRVLTLCLIGLLVAGCGTAPATDSPADTVTANLKIDKEISDNGEGNDAPGSVSQEGSGAATSENSIYFKLGATEIDAEGLAKLARWAARLKENPKARLQLIGHTDNLGSRAYNVAISDQRVNNVVKVLKAQGVPLAHIRKFGLGSERANPRCHSAACQANLRRVEILFIDPTRKK